MRVVSAVAQLLSVISVAGFARVPPSLGPQKLLAAATARSPVSAPKGQQICPAPGAAAPGQGLWDRNNGPAPLGPNGPSEYQLNLGKAIDTLRVDHPRLFTHAPDLSIFTEDVQLHDTTGVRLRGKPQYERAFGMLRFIKRAALQQVEVTHRMVVHEQTIRMRWTAKVWLRDPNLDKMGMGQIQAKLVYLDGVSVYSLNDKGIIYRHRLENVVLRNSGQTANVANLVFAWPGAKVPELANSFFRTLDAALPAGLHGLASTSADDGAPRVVIEPIPIPAPLVPPPGKGRRHGVPYASIEEPATETPMQRAARERAEMAEEKERRIRQAKAKEPPPKRAAFPFNPFALGAPQQCESSYDCEAPMVCCDLIVASVCCTGGMMIPTKSPQQRLQEQMIPIPVERDRPNPGAGLPPNYPGPPRY
jgi:hypothetical protein